MDTVVLISRLLHSWTRWAFLIIALVALVLFIQGLLQKRAYDKRAGTALNIYSSVLSLQWLLGLVLLIAWGSMSGFGQRHFWEHLTVQTLAVIVANAHHGWRRREMADSRRWRNGLLVIVISLALVFVGIFVLPVGIQWRLFVP